MNKKLIISSAILATVLSTGLAFAEDQELYNTWDGSKNASKITYEYKPDSLFEVHTKVGYVTDLKLKPGENITYMAAGDTSRWLIDKSTVAGVTHVYIKPIAKGIMTNLIINTSSHSYRLLIDEGSGFSAIVEFSFPKEEMQKQLLKPMPLTKEEKTFNDIFTTKDKYGRRSLKKINRHYKVKKHGRFDDDILPEEIFDDGTRTYFKMPQSNKYDLPTLYLVDDSGKLSLVNYRTRSDYFVADRVFTKARLKYSNKKWIDVTPVKPEETSDNDSERTSN